MTIKTNDPQTIVDTVVNMNEKNEEVINFKVSLNLFELLVTLPIPMEDDEKEGKAYLKRLNSSGSETPGEAELVVPTVIKNGTNGGDLITFSLSLGLFQLVAVVPIPFEGCKNYKAYLKFKIMNNDFVPAPRNRRNFKSNEHHSND